MAEINKIGNCFKVVLRSPNATVLPDGTHRYDVNLKDIEGETLRCVLSKVRHPAPASYTPRRLWLASGHVWLNSHLDGQAIPRQPNDYNNMLAKYGLSTNFFGYYPRLNLYFRMSFGTAATAQIRQVSFAVSQDGINWVGGSMTSFGLQEGVDFSAGAVQTAPFDFIEIDIQSPRLSPSIPNTIPPSYIYRRMWFASGNTWKPAATPVGSFNSYDSLLQKYGINTWIYMYYPFRNHFVRIRFNSPENASIRNTTFSRSADNGANWTTGGTSESIGWVTGVDFSGNPNVGIDLWEIDMGTLPFGTLMQNIHCPQLKASSSYDSVSHTTTDIIGNIGNNQNFNPYVMNDATYNIHDTDCGNEISGDTLRGLRTLDIYFSRVSTPNVKEQLPLNMPWTYLLELMFFKTE